MLCDRIESRMCTIKAMITTRVILSNILAIGILPKPFWRTIVLGGGYSMVNESLLGCNPG